jgi:hypothetical protein
MQAIDVFPAVVVAVAVCVPVRRIHIYRIDAVLQLIAETVLVGVVSGPVELDVAKPFDLPGIVEPVLVCIGRPDRSCEQQ